MNGALELTVKALETGVSPQQILENALVPAMDKVPEYIISNKETVENTTNKPILAGVIGPFSPAGRLFDMLEIMVACYMEPEAIACLLGKCTAFIKNYFIELKRIDCSGVVIAEPAAGLLSDEAGQYFSSQYVKQIVALMRYNVKGVLFALTVFG
ncbi:MAG: uroporphyrinogen decarboxylase family protein [Bacteroidota bacterium]|nr:uroporphyrinogen decarboxylase family protein [Bacteroidota bacterium]